MDAFSTTAKSKRNYKSNRKPRTRPLVDASESITQSRKRNLENWNRWLKKGNNHQKYLEYLKKWRLKNKQHTRQYRLKNRERLNESVKQWKLRNSDKVAEYRRTGRLRKQQMKVLKEINELVSRPRPSNHSRLSSSSKVMEIV